MGRPLAPEEEWARQLLGHALGAEVRQHDDGSVPGMFDLLATYVDGRRAAVEVVTATDGDAVELWKLVNGDGRMIVPGIAGGWMLQLSLDARAKRLLAELPDFLRVLDAQGEVEFDDEDDRFPPRRDVDARYARSLGIRHMRRSESTDFSGSVYFTVDLGADRTGGFVPDHAEALPAWIGPWLAESSQADVVAKLERSGCPERHAFVVVPAFPTAPFEVIELLMRDRACLPTSDPGAPAPLTHLWVVSSWRQGHGFSWSPGAGWSTFDKLQA